MGKIAKTQKTMSKKKTLLFIDEDTFTVFKQREDKLKATVNEVMQLAETALGIDKVDNVKQLLENPADYLVNMYWEMYCKDYPQHLDKENVFLRDLGISVERLTQLKFKFDKQINDLKEYAPTINKIEIEYKVKPALFERYLNPNKEDHYKALKNFIDASKKLKEYEPNCKPIHLIRYSNSLIFKGSEAEINEHQFI